MTKEGYVDHIRLILHARLLWFSPACAGQASKKKIPSDTTSSLRDLGHILDVTVTTF